jgi:hypothetical protein
VPVFKLADEHPLTKAGLRCVHVVEKAELDLRPGDQAWIGGVSTRRVDDLARLIIIPGPNQSGVCETQIRAARAVPGWRTRPNPRSSNFPCWRDRCRVRPALSEFRERAGFMSTTKAAWVPLTSKVFSRVAARAARHRSPAGALHELLQGGVSGPVSRPDGYEALGARRAHRVRTLHS